MPVEKRGREKTPPPRSVPVKSESGVAGRKHVVRNDQGGYSLRDSFGAGPDTGNYTAKRLNASRWGNGGFFREDG